MILLLPILVFTGLFAPSVGQAYPDFISYGYNTCITCHYNGQGNGPLNDYGRALFSTEIASRALFSEKATEEEIAAQSGFLGSTQLPWWIRPGIKYRGLYFVNSPGSEAAVKRYVTMQGDLNVAIQLDSKAKYLIVLSGGFSPTPAARQNSKDPKDKNLISREHYFRWQMHKKFFTYFGLMDKVYGIRTADHTAYSREVTGVAQNDQAHGVMAQYYGDSWEFTAQGFAGNLIQEDAPNRQKGGALMAEFDLAEKSRIGTGVLYSANEFVKKTRFEIHSKLGLDKGNSFLTEIGLVQNNPVAVPNKKFGGYLRIENIYLITRGYNLLSQVEYYNATLSPESPDRTRWTVGFLTFPMPRMEFRAGFVNGRAISDTSISKDQWSLQTQLHLSL